MIKNHLKTKSKRSAPQRYASELAGLLRSRLPAFLGAPGEGAPDIIAAVLQVGNLFPGLCCQKK
jgi:hypothetical protein